MGIFLHLSSWIGRNHTRIRKFTNRPSLDKHNVED
jgi:hypothetical protein